MDCNCKNINPLFLKAIEDSIHRSYFANREELLPIVESLAKDCGYERNKQGEWVQFPKQETTLDKIGEFNIITEHDDGDLTIESRTFGKLVVTTDGEVFSRLDIKEKS